jgi:hypothetical protein
MDKLKEQIEAYERRVNQLYKISCARVSADNIECDGSFVTADIWMCMGEGEPETIYRGCEYPLCIIEKIEV